MIEEEKKIKIKVMTLGNYSVGKTSFIQRVISNKFTYSHFSTIGYDYKFKDIILPNGEKVTIQFIDTAGQERFFSIAKNMIKNADGIILIYDITKKQTFESISNWMENIRENKGENFPIILIGNKSDLEDEREISKEEGEAKANQLKLHFFETSNKDGINIEKSVIQLINKIFEQKNADIHLKKNDIQRKKKKKKKGFKLFSLFKSKSKSEKNKNKRKC